MQLTLAPGFKSPDPQKFDREHYSKYIVEKLPAEIPQMFGLHPNAEIGYLTTTAEELFSQIMQVQGGGSGGGKGRKEDIARIYIDKFLEELPENFFMIEITSRVEEFNPYVVVVLQECERMNTLLNECRISLIELDQGLKGQLNITDAMENLSTALSINKVPAGWESKAYFSLKTLADWFGDLKARVLQL